MHALSPNKERDIYPCTLHENKAMMSISTIYSDAQQEESPRDRRRGRSDGIRATQKQRWRWLGLGLGDIGVSLQGYHISNTSSSLVKMPHRYPTRPQKQSPDPDIRAISRSVVVDGAEHVVSYGGTSQYNRDGTGASACGLAALNFARIVFSMEQSGLQDTTLLQAVLARACAEVRRRYSNPLVSVHRLISTGNHGYMCIVVGQPSSRS
jgi:hypothetical protein